MPLKNLYAGANWACEDIAIPRYQYGQKPIYGEGPSPHGGCTHGPHSTGRSTQKVVPGRHHLYYVRSSMSS